ncbi:MAG TPA: phosphoribosylformylglycinamidine synthase subunit PurL [Methanothrix sp.]|nr:phosphoribosylformylglycinamidine synthase subunit PurL [Methanothrix sp.]HOV82599.1 phosphoribosylformylglycinamidine synthase subunit PurL [Methanothrix sp.]HPC90138.1 phosphoribosylformylglycinamidine synthase subunit PurL [Methanothrix sp.]HQE87849.1 phosphoribosylformylglycinamidine synthase subunit PurL [Methanothrix sp.]HQI68206.1 phosphoribosylformylglycinamidine synthase subunit PurL [Methanothrix sp.]
MKIIGLSDPEVQAELRAAGIGMSVPEARSIAEVLGRDPTLTELFCYDAMWSEHCSYKSSRATLKEFLPSDGPNVVMGPVEDSGIVAIDDKWCVVISHESHNHPSQILPNEGAATGIGGIVRDVNCMGATVVATADPLRFGDPYGPKASRVRWVAEGVVDGIWQYGNALGVPNIGGDIVFNESFDDNCLVNVVSLGIVRRDQIIRSRAPPLAGEMGYDVILIGKPTDSSGLGGVTFASEALREEDEETNRGAVQIPDPFLKNVLFKANGDLFRLVREEGVEIGFKDLGGGGFTCAASEMGSAGGFGMEINLDDMHKAADLPPEVLSIAETQERFLIISPPHLRERILKIYNDDWDLPNVYEGARASVVGRINSGDRFTVTYKGETVCDVPIQHLTGGIRYSRMEAPPIISLAEPQVDEPADFNEVLLKILRSPNIASREHVYRYYDTEVMGNAAIRPGEADAGLIAPVRGERFGVALATDSNPFYGRISPFWGGATAVAEAMRNVAAIGAVPSTLTDCLNYGNPEKPEAFWEFREGVKGVAEACRNLYLKGYQDQQQAVPIVSGNVSFYNESPAGSVDPSPVIACVGIMKDAARAVTMHLKAAGDRLYLIGPRYDELGGSEYYRTIFGVTGANVPIVRYELERNMIYAVIDAIDDGLLAAAHDISNGGLAASLAEMALTRPARFGLEVDLNLVHGGEGDACMRSDRLLFSESSGFVLEALPGKEERLERILKGYGIDPMPIGRVTARRRIVIKRADKTLADLDLDEAGSAWAAGLPEAMR